MGCPTPSRPAPPPIFKCVNGRMVRVHTVPRNQYIDFERKTDWIEPFMAYPVTLSIESEEPKTIIIEDRECERAWYELFKFMFSIPWRLPGLIRKFNRRYLK